MGVKFALSVANPLMTQWEENVVYHNLPKQLLLYKRFRDVFFTYFNYLLIVFEKLNDNEKNIM